MNSSAVSSQNSAPQVAVRQSRMPLILFSLAMVGVVIALFVGLESARTARQPASEVPAAVNDDDLVRSTPASDLYIPPVETQGTQQPSALDLRLVTYAQPLPPVAFRSTTPAPVSRTAPVQRYDVPVPASTYSAPWTPPPPVGEVGGGRREDGMRAAPPGRTTATRIRNLSATVVQGTLVSAVLESALDSTRAGQARALVTRDVKGFDGTRVLIPRGSRLFGDYASDAAAGQNRIMISWSRLILPDGVSIALDSPVADPLGRAGVRASVDSHLWTRVENALVDGGASLGANLLGRRLGSTNQVIVALPGAVQSGSTSTPQAITPTLKVKQGARISVFVAHDLDFSSDLP